MSERVKEEIEWLKKKLKAVEGMIKVLDEVNAELMRRTDDMLNFYMTVCTKLMDVSESCHEVNYAYTQVGILADRTSRKCQAFGDTFGDLHELVMRTKLSLEEQKRALERKIRELEEYTKKA